MDNVAFSPREIAVKLTETWLSNPNTSCSAEESAGFFVAMEKALRGGPPNGPAANHDYPPAVSAKKSLASRTHIISMIDGKPYKTLRRHLGIHGLTPEQHRDRYNLPKSYPMVAPDYSQRRSDMAKRIGLGRHDATNQANATPAVRRAQKNTV